MRSLSLCPWRARCARHPFLVPGVLLALWLLATIGVRPLAMPDEGRYGSVALHMLLSGDWITPRLDGMPFFHKPPLYYWLAAGAMQLLGAAPWVARLPAALAAWTMGMGTYLFLRSHAGPRIAGWTLLVLATMPLLFGGGQYLNLDMLVGALISVTILAGAHAVLQAQRQRPFRRWVWIAYGLAGLGVLAKGLIGIVLPGGVLLVWLAWQRRGADILRLLSPVGMGLFAVVVLPWYGAMEQRFPGFFHYFFVYQQFQRFAAGGFNNAHPAWFYPATLILMCLPWTLWFLRPLWCRSSGPAARSLPAMGAWGRPVPPDSAAGLDRLAVVWLLLILLFFSLPESKLVGYILPVLPAWAFLVVRIGMGISSEQPRSSSASAEQTPANACSPSPRLVGATVLGAVALCLATVIAITLMRPQPAAAAARWLAPRLQPGDQVVMLDSLASDLQFHLAKPTPSWIVSVWDDPEAMWGDTWRKELWDAGEFDPAVRHDNLLTFTQFRQRLCSPTLTHTLWLWGSVDVERTLPLLAHAPLVWQAPASDRDHRRLWQLTPADAHRLAGCPAPVSR